MCNHCFAQGIQVKKERMANKAVANIVAAMKMESPICLHYGKNTRVRIVMEEHSHVLFNAFWNQFCLVPSFQVLCREEMFVRKIVLPERSSVQQDIDLLSDAVGGTLDSHAILNPLPPHRVLEAPIDNSYGYIEMPLGKAEAKQRMEQGLSPNNHVLLVNSTFCLEDVVECMKVEAEYRKKGVIMKRSGPAGGYTIPGDNNCKDPASLTKGTKTRRTCVVSEDSNSTYFTAFYWSKKEKRFIQRSVYADIDGRVLKPGTTAEGRKNSKFLLAWQSPAYRSLIVRKMEARVKYLVILEAFGHQPDELLQHMKLCANNWERIKEANAAFAPEITDNWKRFLLLYSVNNIATYINHQACCAHKDGQGNETMTLYGSYDGGSLDATAMLKNAVPGEIALLDDRIGVRLHPHQTIMHATLDRTLHAADQTRNSRNSTDANCEERRRRRRQQTQ